MPLQEIWNRSLRLRTTMGSTAEASTARARSARALFSTRSTVAIRSSIRVPVNVISNVPVFFPGPGLVLFFLGRSEKTPPQSCGLFIRNGRLPKLFTRHALPSPHRGPGSFSGLNFTTLSAARILALRDRGLRSISSSPAVTGFLVSSRYQPRFAPSRSASLTILSSSE